MTLGNMRENGVRSLLVTCSNVTCRHEKIVNVDAYGDDLFVPSFGQGCGVSGAASAARTFGPIGMRRTNKRRSPDQTHDRAYRGKPRASDGGFFKAA